MEEVFAKFRRGVEQHIPVTDVESHLALADAYLEMGLFEDALREAAVALERGVGLDLNRALRLLLAGPLLKPGGIEVLKKRLAEN